jgi:hypothetical protein
MNVMGSILLRLFLTGIALFVLLLPMEFFWVVQHLLAPEGFWQNLVLYGIGFYFLAAIQFILGIVLLVALFMIWFSE